MKVTRKSAAGSSSMFDKWLIDYISLSIILIIEFKRTNDQSNLFKLIVNKTKNSDQNLSLDSLMLN